jgi:hypothetical protein
VVEELPGAAVQALSDGCETPSLIRLAGMEGSSWSEAEPVLRRVFEERGRVLPSTEEAVKSVADQLLHQLAAGEVDPHDATERLRVLAWKVDGPAWDDLLVFVGLSDEWDDAHAGYLDRDAVRDTVQQQVREMLDRGGIRPQRSTPDRNCSP